ncbi:hypothetical protein SAMN05216303_106151 [Rhodoferax sp. OV413]|uniref:site-2 protease family protein n=1 Tax=Rhodoferax sp. OV413 TaxID=1855285 RepID=UPI000884E9ED|nr:site-2 protease family protein [Rhodoferax sp. OV413]SDP69571.1 hypothetical protein SAMN05216303_106151 [Rhodoferax sp. OV413]
MKLLLALLAAGKLGKVALSGGTMLLSVFVYAISYGWAYAIGIVGLLFVHEMGHFIAAKNRGLAVGAPVFIPFVGAWISLKTVDLDPETEAYVGLAGPMLGTAGAFLCYLYAQESGQKLWLAIAYTGFILNLFNLIPLTPLDGGRIVSVVSPKLWLLGVPLLCGVFFWKPSPMLLIIAVLAAPKVWAAIKGEASEGRQIASLQIKLQYGIQYLLLIVVLAVLALDAHEKMGVRSF